jgi:hypothetical protein
LRLFKEHQGYFYYGGEFLKGLDCIPLASPRF